MIDKEKLAHIIKNKFSGYLEAAVEVYPSLREQFESCSKFTNLLELAAIKGVHWYIQELWHPAKDIPKEEHGKYILALTKYEGPQVIDVDEYMDREEYEDFDEEETWDDIVEEEGVVKWCYIFDLLPQKGDKK